MLLPIQSFANWKLTGVRHGENNTPNLLHEIQCCRFFDWQPGMEVLMENINNKMDPNYIAGPFPITHVHTNGTVTICRQNTFQQINIGRIKLYHQPE
jgi:hypothetical protein